MVGRSFTHLLTDGLPIIPVFNPIAHISTPKQDLGVIEQHCLLFPGGAKMISSLPFNIMA